jgi:hypothetical protein
MANHWNTHERQYIYVFVNIGNDFALFGLAYYCFFFLSIYGLGSTRDMYNVRVIRFLGLVCFAWDWANGYNGIPARVEEYLFGLEADKTATNGLWIKDGRWKSSWNGGQVLWNCRKTDGTGWMDDFQRRLGLRWTGLDWRC